MKTKVYDCPECGMRGDVEQQRKAFNGGQHEDNRECVAFLRRIGVADAAVMSSLQHDRLERAFNAKHDATVA